MKKTRFTDEQMVTVLREADRRPVPEVAKRHGGERPDDLQLAQTLRDAGTGQRDLGFSGYKPWLSAYSDSLNRSGERVEQVAMFDLHPFI